MGCGASICQCHDHIHEPTTCYTATQQRQSSSSNGNENSNKDKDESSPVVDCIVRRSHQDRSASYCSSSSISNIEILDLIKKMQDIQSDIYQDRQYMTSIINYDVLETRVHDAIALLLSKTEDEVDIKEAIDAFNSILQECGVTAYKLSPVP